MRARWGSQQGAWCKWEGAREGNESRLQTEVGEKRQSARGVEARGKGAHGGQAEQSAIRAGASGRGCVRARRGSQQGGGGGTKSCQQEGLGKGEGVLHACRIQAGLKGQHMFALCHLSPTFHVPSSHLPHTCSLRPYLQVHCSTGCGLHVRERARDSERGGTPGRRSVPHVGAVHRLLPRGGGGERAVQQV